MNFELSEEQEMIRRLARDYLENECPESFVREMEKDDLGYSPRTWSSIADLGWLGMVYPEKYGGVGGSILDMTVLYEEMGRAMFPSPHLSTVVLCGLTILNAGSEEQKADLLPRIANGDLILALALTEPEAIWDRTAWEPDGVTCGAMPDQDDYIITGVKLFVHDAHIADYLLCVTRTADSARPEDGITLFLVDAKSAGISHATLKTTAGDKQSEVMLDKVRVSRKDMIGGLNQGWLPLARSLQVGAVMLCAEMVGVGWRLLELTVDYAKTRIQFDVPIGINQYVQGYCTDLLSEVDGSKNVTYRAAWRLSENLPCDYEVAVAKAWTSDSHERACVCAHQVLAGVGTSMDDGALPLYSRRGKSQQLYLGDTAHHLRRVAQHLDEWPAPEKPRGKPLGIWKIPEDEKVPSWQPWRERWEKTQNSRQGQKGRKT